MSIETDPGTTAAQTQRSADRAPSDQTTSPQIRDDVFELRARSAEARDRVSTLANEVEQVHNHVQAIDLDDRTSALVQNEPRDLLSVLGEDRGLPWSLVAQLVGVSATAVRKWRRGGQLTAESRTRLARLVAFCRIVMELNPQIGDVALWLQSPLTGATTLTPTDLFAQGSEIALINLAAKRISAESLLDAEVPGWRTATRPDTRHRVVEAPDGVMSIVAVE